MKVLGNLEISDTCVRIAGADVVPLTALELKVLNRLAQESGAVSVQALHQSMYGKDPSNSDSNVLQVVVSRLRKKLPAAGAQVAIQTVRGSGYSLEAVTA